jgi:hypothetical protein
MIEKLSYEEHATVIGDLLEAIKESGLCEIERKFLGEYLGEVLEMKKAKPVWTTQLTIDGDSIGKRLEEIVDKFTKPMTREEYDCECDDNNDYETTVEDNLLERVAEIEKTIWSMNDEFLKKKDVIKVMLDQLKVGEVDLNKLNV